MKITEKLKWKLVAFLIGKTPIMINCTINGAGIKKGWTVCGDSGNKKAVITGHWQ
jgi:hypothetical protein